MPRWKGMSKYQPGLVNLPRHLLVWVRFFIPQASFPCWIQCYLKARLYCPVAFLLLFWISTGQTKREWAEFLTIPGSESGFHSRRLQHRPLKVFNLYYHNEGPWLYKSSAFSRTKQKVDFLWVALSNTHAHERAWVSAARPCSFLSALRRSLRPEPGQSKLPGRGSGQLWVKWNQTHRTEASSVRTQTLIEKRF